MGYYASGSGSLSLREGHDEAALAVVLEELNEAWGWSFDQVHPLQLEVSYSEKYRGVQDDLAKLAPFVNDGEYLQFTGENDAVWRLRFTDGHIVEQNAIWP